MCQFPQPGGPQLTSFSKMRAHSIAPGSRPMRKGKRACSSCGSFLAERQA